MLRPSKKLALALEAVVDIAFHGGSEPVQSQDISRRLGLPRRYLEQVMQQLVRAGVLKGVRGRGDSRRAARERRRISVGEVVRVVQGLEEPLGDDGPLSESALGTRVIGPFWEQIEADLMDRLDGVSIEDLCREGERRAIESEGRRSFDFVI